MILIGTGILNWPRQERVGDRYGLVGLYKGDNPLPWGVEAIKIEFRSGQLIAKVLEARQSQHIGDLFHGFFPETPEVGEEIVLGEGDVFFEEDEYDDTFIGLRPENENKPFWLDPKKLYRAHSQYVELYFKEAE